MRRLILSVALAAVPLILKLVPPNRVYGLRTQRTLKNRDLWFQANRFAGWALFVAAAMSASVFVALPELASGRSIIGLFVFVVPLLVAVVVSLAYLRRLGTAGDSGSDV